MATGLDQETRAIIDQTLGRFVRDHGDIHHRRDRLARRPVNERTHWSLMAELGILAIPFAEEVGGIGGAAVDVGAAAALLGGGLVLEPFIEGVIVPAAVLATGPGGAAAVIEGRELTVLVGGRPSDGDRVRASVDGDRIRISGRASVVPAANVADTWLVVAWRGDGSPLVARLAAASDGVNAVSHRLMDGRGAADITFNGVVLPSSAVLLDGGAARAALGAASVRAVAAYAADAVGVMERMVRETGAYLVTRKQFGVVIGSFQALQHRFADMHMACLETAAMVRALAVAIDGAGGGEPRWMASAAASVVERAAGLIGHEAIQMHGGMGATEELPISHLNARLVVLTRLIRAWTPRGAFSGGEHDD